MNKKSIFILMLLIVILAISSTFVIKEIADNKKSKDLFDNIEDIAQQQIDNNNNLSIEDCSEITNTDINLNNILEINSDVVGWIKIEGTNINYPIMQKEDYYLYRNIYKEYSSHGTPYLASHCNLEDSDNLIIYGHHMNDNSMFSQLDNYKKYKFYTEHKFIEFYTIKDGQTVKDLYEIVIAFKTVAYSNKGFKYYNYTNFKDENDFNSFVDACQKLEFYATESSITYGDELITLSTCEYSQKNGRMVIVAKKI